MGFKIKKPRPPSVKNAVKAVQKAAPRPASNAAKSVRSASSNAKKGASSIARGAQRMSKAAKPTAAKAAKAIKQAGKPLTAKATKIKNSPELRRIGSRQQIGRKLTQNRITTAKLSPGRYNIRYRPSKPPKLSSLKPKVAKASSAIKQLSKKSAPAINKVSKAAGKVGALAAKGTPIIRNIDIPRIGSQYRRRRINTRNTTATRIIRPGSYVVRDRLRPSSGGLPKSPAARNLLNKAKKTFSNPGKPIAKAVKSPKKALSKKIKAASKAKVQFPKNVKGPKATCPLLKQKGVKQSNAMFKAPKLSMPKSKVKAGAVIGGAIGAMVGGVPGAVIGAAIGAGVGRLQELNKPKIINRRTPKNPRAGKEKPGDQAARTAAAAAVWPGPQHYNNCGVQSCAQIIFQATGTNPNEDTLLATAINNSWAGNGGATRPIPIPVPARSIPFAAGGTRPGTRTNILRNAGVPSHVSDYSRETLAQAIWERRGVVANLETSAASWWQNLGGTGSGLHAVIVTDGVFNAKGELTHVVINDTGVGIQGRTLTIEEWEKAVNAHGDPALNITDNPIWP